MMELKLLVMKVVRKGVGSTHGSDYCWFDDCSKNTKDPFGRCFQVVSRAFIEFELSFGPIKPSKFQA